jgi:hypothetical protein
MFTSQRAMPLPTKKFSATALHEAFSEWLVSCGQQPPRSQDVNQGDYLWVTLEYSSCQQSPSSVRTGKQNLKKTDYYFKTDSPS